MAASMPEGSEQKPAEAPSQQQQLAASPQQLFVQPQPPTPLGPAKSPIAVEAPSAERDAAERGEGSRGSDSGKQGWWAAPLAAVQRPFRSKDTQPPGDGPPSAGEARPAKLVQSGYRSKALVRTRVEPKTFFANERTFLSWLQISVLIMLTGLSLLGGSFSSFSSSSGSSSCSAPPTATPAFQSPTGSPPSEAPSTPTFSTFNCKASQYAGLVISPVAVLFMIYALFMYKMRTVQIMQQRKNVRYDDQRGPVFLVVLLVGALLTAMVFTARAAFAS